MKGCYSRIIIYLIFGTQALLANAVVYRNLAGPKSNLLVVGGYHLEDYINHTGGIHGNSTVIPGSKGVQANLTHIWSKNISCDALEDTKELVIGATGGVIQNRPLICGGLDIYGNISRSCYELGPKGLNRTLEEWDMLSPRADAQSIVIKRGTWPNNLVEKLWIIGGRNGTFWVNDSRFYTTHDWMNTTEFHSFGEDPEYGPDLPDFMNGFCACKIDDHRVIIMGGKYRNTPKATFSKKVWIYNFQDPNYGWRPKDDMRYEREGQFGCTSFKDSSYYDNRTMVMVIGGHPNRYVEMYDVTNRKWDYAHDFPAIISDVTAVTVTLPDQREVPIVIGGVLTTELGKNGVQTWSKKIYMYDCRAHPYYCIWHEVETNQTLEQGHIGHVAMMVPHNITHCVGGSNHIFINNWALSFAILSSLGWNLLY